MTGLALGPGILVALGLYLMAMVGLGLLSRRRATTSGLDEFYLANRNLGTLVLFLTLYATQYSGNSLLGFPGQAYRVGYLWVMSVGFMVSVIVAYQLFAPRLYRLSRQQRFVTPGDWLDHRFGSPLLSLIANILLLLVVTNFLLAQLIAIGHLVEALSDGAIPYAAGILALGLVMVLYESLGGMRAVAWTDCAQALLLFFGLVGILLVLLPGLEGLGAARQWIMAHAPQKAAVPQGKALQGWFSTLILVAFSACVYPQAVQRIFAARDRATLRNSLRAMAFMPWVTTFPMFLIGILAIPQLAALEGIAADEVMPQLLHLWSEQSLWLHAMAILVLTGTVAAIMSTADSVLLSLSSIVAKDLLGKTVMAGAAPERLARLGKIVSWLVMLLLMAIAVSPGITLWGLIELKLEILIQTAPLFILAVLWPRLEARGALAGLLVGVLIGGGLTLAGYGKLGGWHAGVIGLAGNLLVALTVSRFWPQAARPKAA